MQHQTPQFIEIEDKVVGPFTIRQFLYLAGGAGAFFLLYRFLPFFLFLVFGTIVAAFAGGLAFYRYNERPFIELVESAFKYIVNSRLYLWRHRKPEDIKREQESIAIPQKNQVLNPSAGLSSSRLKDLSWNLEVKDDK